MNEWCVKERYCIVSCYTIQFNVCPSLLSAIQLRATVASGDPNLSHRSDQDLVHILALPLIEYLQSFFSSLDTGESHSLERVSILFRRRALYKRRGSERERARHTPKVGPILFAPSTSLNSIPPTIRPGTISRVRLTIASSAVFISRPLIPPIFSIACMLTNLLTEKAPKGPSCPVVEMMIGALMVLGSMQD